MIGDTRVRPQMSPIKPYIELLKNDQPEIKRSNYYE